MRRAYHIDLALASQVFSFFTKAFAAVLSTVVPYLLGETERTPSRRGRAGFRSALSC